MSVPRPTWYLFIAVTALIWNLMGVALFLAHLLMPAYMFAELSATERAVYEDLPVWALSTFAVAVFSGTLGCIFLILRKSEAFWILLLSLIGVIVRMAHLSVNGAFAYYRPIELIMPIMIAVIAIALVWVARVGNQRQ